MNALAAADAECLMDISTSFLRVSQTSCFSRILRFCFICSADLLLELDSTFV